VTDLAATALEPLVGAQFVALASEPMETWTSVYSVTADLPLAFYREVARYAGAHVWSGKGDTFYAKRSCACLHANGPGPRTIPVPGRCDLWDAIREESLGRGSSNIIRDFEHGETVTPRWQ
jgi:hypothetical protein